MQQESEEPDPAVDLSSQDFINAMFCKIKIPELKINTAIQKIEE